MVTTEKTLSLVANFETVKDILSLTGPESLKDVRAAALAKFAAVGIPTTRDEEFKYLPLNRLRETEYQPAYGSTLSEEDLAELPLAKLDGPYLTLVNGEFAPELSNISGLPNGVRVMALSEALGQHEGLVTRVLGKVATHEGKLGSTNDERFTHLNTAYLSEGVYVFVAKGVMVEPTIHLRFITRADHGAIAVHPRVVIELESGAAAKVIESYHGLGGESFTNVVHEIMLGEAANLEYVKAQTEGASTIHISNIYVDQKADSVFTSNQVSFGAAISRTDLNVFGDGEHTETSLNGAYLGQGEQLVDNHTRIDHAKPNCHSFEVYKGILDDRSVGVFNGKIFVYEDAQKTDAKQTNQALLLSANATINTKPQLEIFADDVKCTHGATVGQIREDALFYLRSRGIPEMEARGLLVYAFAAEVLEKISVDFVREALEAELYRRLNRD